MSSETLKFAERKTVVRAAERDDDGKEAESGGFVSPSQLAQLNELADEVTADKVKFCKYFKIGSFADLPAKKFDHAMQLLEAKRGGK